MSYQKHNWVSREIIRREYLQNIEDGIYNEQERGEDAESTLDSKINAEISRAQNKEASLQSQAHDLDSNLTDEISRASQREDSIASSLNSEINRATGIETQLSGLITDNSYSIATEVSRALAAEEALQNDINAKIAGAYKPSGSLYFEDLPSLTAANQGKVYYVLDEFTTTSDFIEGAGEICPAGTYVAIIDASSSETPDYKYDAMSGMVDMSIFVQKTDIATPTTLGIVKPDGTTISINNEGVISILEGEHGSAEAAERMIASIEPTDISSSKAYAVGDNLILNETLYRVTSAISIGDALVVGTNIVASNNVSKQISDLKSSLATVATSGSYNDLSNKPTIPTYSAGNHGIAKSGTTFDSYVPRSNGDYNNDLPGANKFNVVEHSTDSPNRPTNHWYYVITMQGGDSAYATQIAYGMTTGRNFVRTYQGGNWLAWNELGTIYKVSSLNANTLSEEGMWYVYGSITGAPSSSHGVLWYVKSIGTPFQIYFPDTVPTIYKRWYSNGSWSDWSDLNSIATNRGWAGNNVSMTSLADGYYGTNPNQLPTEVSSLINTYNYFSSYGTLHVNKGSGGVYPVYEYMDVFGQVARWNSNQNKWRPFRRPTGNATAAQVLSGYTASNESSDGFSGSIPQRDYRNQYPALGTGHNGTGSYVYIPYGYYNPVENNDRTWFYLTDAQVQGMHKHTATKTPTGGELNSSAMNLGDFHGYKNVNTAVCYAQGSKHYANNRSGYNSANNTSELRFDLYDIQPNTTLAIETTSSTLFTVTVNDSNGTTVMLGHVQNGHRFSGTIPSSFSGGTAFVYIRPQSGAEQNIWVWWTVSNANY